jgi:flagellar basal body rod protein FlgF
MSAVDDDDEEELDKPSKPLPVEVSEDGGVEVKGEDGQRLAFRQGVISMEQVRRLAMQSAYRSGLAS